MEANDQKTLFFEELQMQSYIVEVLHVFWFLSSVFGF